MVAAPATPETRNMLGEREFALMKPSAYLINVARGTLLDEPALISALERNVIAGAALDVTVKEPLPPESPLWKMNNVVITPHVSGATESTWEREEELMAENLTRWFAGRELLNRVDLTTRVLKGYAADGCLLRMPPMDPSANWRDRLPPCIPGGRARWFSSSYPFCPRT